MWLRAYDGHIMGIQPTMGIRSKLCRKMLINQWIERGTPFSDPLAQVFCVWDEIMR